AVDPGGNCRSPLEYLLSLDWRGVHAYRRCRSPRLASKAHGTDTEPPATESPGTSAYSHPVDRRSHVRGVYPKKICRSEEFFAGGIGEFDSVVGFGHRESWRPGD